MALSNVEVNMAVRELKSLLENSRFDKIQNLDGNSFKLRFQKHDLIFQLPEAVYVTKYKREPSQKVSNFCEYVRKQLKGSFLKEISQHGFDRVLTLKFSNGFRLVIELFSTGNLVIVDPKGKTKHAHHFESWRDRETKPNKEYKYPTSRGFSPPEITREEFNGLFMKQDTIRSLVANINMSGTYLEEVCHLAGVDKSKSLPTEEDKKKLFRSLKALLSREIKPGIQDGRAVPFKLESLGGEFTPRDSFNEAIDDTYSKIELPEPGDTELGRLKHRLDEQKQALEKFEKQVVEFKAKGDAIYASFNKLNALIGRISGLRKEGKSREEINRKIAPGARVEPKTGKLVVEI
jgi:predicted ribosome quality control (RQC) complex YloA/Tae2 family protein